ncbi:hypothetical protein ABZ738_07670 [Micromonospora sp. NPDC047793]|uniref:hypothetical protein n=1 Tax=unclassified Micromonospora TaxID=2617518 RepID=UPI001375883F|nr:hypothetical protein [Verrucosispora sp. SN26_14.1]
MIVRTDAGGSADESGPVDVARVVGCPPAAAVPDVPRSASTPVRAPGNAGGAGGTIGA